MLKLFETKFGDEIIMVKLSAFGDSVLRGVIFENNCYKYSKECFVNLLKADLCADIENKGKFGATITAG